jgi:ribonuclease P protein component
MVVPKRHARRSVTRTLVKREMRSGVGNVSAALPPGDWVVRLRAPFDPKRYLSARSEALLHEVRAELAQLISDALRQTTLARRAGSPLAPLAPASGA